MNLNSRIWIDMKNSHEPLFFRSIIKNLPHENFVLTSRDYAELNNLLDKYRMKYTTYGSHGGRNFLRKTFERVFKRNFHLLRSLDNFDIALSFMSLESAFVGSLRDKKVISFTDNEIPQIYTKASLKFIDHLILPSAINQSDFNKLGIKSNKICQYEGYKEDIYIADFIPDSSFMDSIPFGDFVVVRPEAYKATYVSKNVKTIVPKLVRYLISNGENVIYLPRYPEDERLVSRSTKNIYIPSNPLNGLDLCYYSKCVLTGSGTLAREAACLGVPSVSFFPEILLAVDQMMVNQKLIYHSRDIEKILDYISNCERKIISLDRSKKVQKEVISLLRKIMA